MSDGVSAKAGQLIQFTYPYGVPERFIVGEGPSRTEVTLTTVQAVDLYEQLRAALFD
jgi:hypothetical protein